MFRTRSMPHNARSTFPHACGDVPDNRPRRRRASPFSPRLWGCSVTWDVCHHRHALFPTPVGMFREPPLKEKDLETFPHACGDVPVIEGATVKCTHFSPRLWGCSVHRQLRAHIARLFPTPVGMFRAAASQSRPTATFPHACGDVPVLIDSRGNIISFSPRLWGCSGPPEVRDGRGALFPTPVGMFRCGDP